MMGERRPTNASDGKSESILATKKDRNVIRKLQSRKKKATLAVISDGVGGPLPFSNKGKSMTFARGKRGNERSKKVKKREAYKEEGRDFDRT